MTALSAALHDHLYRAELIGYSSLLVVGTAQIIIREQFPQLQLPWPIIVIPLMVILFAVALVPPLVIAVRWWKEPEPPTSETDG